MEQNKGERVEHTTPVKEIGGGVCAAKGFVASGIHCGVRKNKTKKDVALIYSETECAAAAVYTTNLVKGAPLVVTKRHLENGKARAIVCNSGNANTCNEGGEEVAVKMCAAVASALSITADDVVVASTGVIGQPLDPTPIVTAAPALAAALTENGSSDANQAIMTTDAAEKSFAVEFVLDGKTCAIGGIAKGSGMIHPNMATMLAFLTSSVAITPSALQCALSSDCPDSFNMVTVDGDTSTNDMVVILANGAAGNDPITSPSHRDYAAFCRALAVVTKTLSRRIAADGEGATKLLECEVTAAPDHDFARRVARAVISSSLVKAAMFGSDANWGRVLCAVGYAGVEVKIEKVSISFSGATESVLVCRGGMGVEFSEECAARILSEREIKISVDLHDGSASATAWGCDLTYDYVKINGDYRT